MRFSNSNFAGSQFEAGVRMCDFGGSSIKPMTLFSNAPWIGEIVQHGQRQQAEQLQPLALHMPDIDGVLRPRGGIELMQSQAYTVDFGKAVANLFADHRVSWRRAHDKRDRVTWCVCTKPATCPDATQILTSIPSPSRDDWLDADLFPLLALSRLQALSVMPDALVDDVIDVDP